MIRLQTKKVGIRSEDLIVKLAKKTQNLSKKKKHDLIFQYDIITESRNHIVFQRDVEKSTFLKI